MHHTWGFGVLDRQPQPFKQDPLIEVLVRVFRVDISSTSICRILYGGSTDAVRVPLSVDFDYILDLVKSRPFQRSKNQRESTKRWIEHKLSIDSEGEDWVLDTRGLIRKANLTFAAKFCLILVRHLLYQTTTYIILTWDRAVLVAALVDRLEINFARLLPFVIHERSFKTSTTCPFACIIFQLYKDAGVPIWHCDVLCTLTRTVDVGVIKDEANVAEQQSGSRVYLKLLSEYLLEAVELAQGDDHVS